MLGFLAPDGCVFAVPLQPPPSPRARFLLGASASAPAYAPPFGSPMFPALPTPTRPAPHLPRALDHPSLSVAASPPPPLTHSHPPQAMHFTLGSLLRALLLAGAAAQLPTNVPVYTGAGPAEIEALHGACYSNSVFMMCVGVRATQNSYSLGVYAGWLSDGTTFGKHFYTNGDSGSCGSGLPRTSTLDFLCGVGAPTMYISEGPQCHYSFQLVGAFACGLSWFMFIPPPPHL